MSEWKSHYAMDKAIARIVHLELENDDLKADNAELRKDKERLEWILSDAGKYWLSYKEDVDKEMEESQ